MWVTEAVAAASELSARGAFNFLLLLHTLIGMASTPFTLAALATSAVPGLEVSGTRLHTLGGEAAFTSAVLSTDRGEVIVRIPSHPGAEVQQSAELLGQAALTEAAREKLPFEVPLTLGMTRARDTRAVVSTFLRGDAATIDAIDSSTELVRSIVSAVAAIHNLPTSIIHQGGLAVRDAEEIRSNARRLVQRATDTGLLPSTVRERWEQVLDSDTFWSFEPTVVHGALDAELLLLEDNTVVGVLGWGHLALGDPAADLSWMLAGSADIAEAAIAHYINERELSGRAQFVARARFHYELEVAKWLLHGTQSHDQSVIDDAVSMLDRLVDKLDLLGAPTPPRLIIDEHKAQQLLDEVPNIEVDLRSETAEFEALDEDRVFEADSDFEDAGTETADTEVEDRLTHSKRPDSAQDGSAQNDSDQK